MYKVIVVGTDGSARASVAVREAVALAKAAGATLHVVYVVRPTSASTMGTEYADHNAIAAAKEEMHKQGNEICALVVADVLLKDPSTPEGEQARALQQTIKQFCRESLAPHKVPAVIKFVRSLDITAAGKLARHDA